jgi:replication initiation protein RepC
MATHFSTKLTAIGNLTTVSQRRNRAPSPPAPADRWQVLDDLTIAREAFGLKPDSLVVLRALLTFLPKDGGDRPIVGSMVWPSNQCLSERSAGMEERTLRRHLARLVDTGLIQRRASPNGKRYSRRFRATITAAYGFDLGPLFSRHHEIDAAAKEAKSRAELVRHLHAEILDRLATIESLPQQTLAKLISGDEMAEIRRMLRRKPNIDLLQNALFAVDNLVTSTLPRPDEAAHSTELSASDGQFVWHLQKANKESYESVTDQNDEMPDGCDEAAMNKRMLRKPSLIPEADNPLAPTDRKPTIIQEIDQIELQQCLESLTESTSFSLEPIRSWRDLTGLARTLSPMIGVTRECFEHAVHVMGEIRAAIALLCIVQKGDAVKRPGAYLRKLTQIAEAGSLSLSNMVRMTARRARAPTMAM